MSKKCVVVAGGTGGHIFPGIAVADYLKAQGWQVTWIGTPDRMEASVVPKHNIEIDFINVKGVRGNGLKRLVKAPFMVINAILQARKVLKNQRPDVVLAMGSRCSVAIHSADLVLTDDDFEATVQAIKWGRNIFHNVSRFL